MQSAKGTLCTHFTLVTEKDDLALAAKQYEFNHDILIFLAP